MRKLDSLSLNCPIANIFIMTVHCGYRCTGTGTGIVEFVDTVTIFICCRPSWWVINRGWFWLPNKTYLRILSCSLTTVTGPRLLFLAQYRYPYRTGIFLKQVLVDTCPFKKWASPLESFYIPVVKKNLSRLMEFVKNSLNKKFDHWNICHCGDVPVFLSGIRNIKIVPDCRYQYRYVVSPWLHFRSKESHLAHPWLAQ